MFILGLTGSIGMGKTTAAKVFRRLGVPVHDADAAVHRLMGPRDRATARIAAFFPGTLAADGAIDRRALADQVFGDDEALGELEAILHPLVRAEEQAFLRAQARARAPVVVLDIPLLFETGGESRVDAVVVVSASPRIQRLRVLKRPGMTAEKFQAILDRQMPDAEKRRRADFVVTTGLGKKHSLRSLAEIVKTVRRRPARHWPPRTRRTPFHA